MQMRLFEQELEIAIAPKRQELLSYFRDALDRALPDDLSPVRFAVTGTNNGHYHAEIGVLGDQALTKLAHPSIFRFVRRPIERTDAFNLVLLVPTGIGAEIGGHAGDAGPVAKLLAELCDTIITHPNVVNASDINEIPDNGLYVEGSVISRLLMGTLGLQRTRSNRVLVVIDAHEDQLFVNAAVNAVNGARSAYGFQCPRIIQLDPPIRLRTQYATSGRAVGSIEGFDQLFSTLKLYRQEYDSIALSSVIDVPHEYHRKYFDHAGTMTNPWGGVEAILTHALSTLLDVPSAHSPMFESREIANVDPGVVEPRMAAEAVSLTFLQCVLKGLHQSPRIVTDSDAMNQPGVITASDVSCLVIPDGCLGLPTLAALEQRIPVIAVRENRNLMRNDLSSLPWAAGMFHTVTNYWEAAGLIAALKAGIAPDSVRRPLQSVLVSSAPRFNRVKQASSDFLEKLANSDLANEESSVTEGKTIVHHQS